MNSPAKKAMQIEFSAEPAPVVPTAAGQKAFPTSALPAATAATRQTDGGKTGIGHLGGMFRDAQKVSELEAEVARLKKEQGVQQMDSALIVASRWANRHADAFKSAEFDELRAEIGNAGGNVQPILVRPLPEAQRTPGGAQYELVFGHRRHEACRQLGLPVSAVVKDLTDAELFAFMDRENRSRQSLSAYEQGMMYRRALDEGLFASNRKLADAVGVDLTRVGKALQIARLPDPVIKAFPSPTAIQFRWGAVLEAVLAKNQDAVLSRARELNGSGASAQEVFEQLTTAAADEAARTAPGTPRTVDFGNGRSATLRLDKKGRLLIQTSPGLLPPERLQDVEAALRALFK